MGASEEQMRTLGDGPVDENEAASRLFPTPRKLRFGTPKKPQPSPSKGLRNLKKVQEYAASAKKRQKT